MDKEMGFYLGELVKVERGGREYAAKVEGLPVGDVTVVRVLGMPGQWNVGPEEIRPLTDPEFAQAIRSADDEDLEGLHFDAAATERARRAEIKINRRQDVLYGSNRYDFTLGDIDAKHDASWYESRQTEEQFLEEMGVRVLIDTYGPSYKDQAERRARWTREDHPEAVVTVEEMGGGFRGWAVYMTSPVSR